MHTIVLRFIESLVIIGIISLYGWNAYGRNLTWKDELTLWTDVARKSPNKYRAYNEIGMFYLERLQIDNAELYFQKSIALNNLASMAYNNLGLCFLGKGLTDSAIEEFKHAINLNPSDGMYHINLGIAYSFKGLPDLANREILVGKKLIRMQKKQPSHHPKINGLDHFKKRN